MDTVAKSSPVRSRAERLYAARDFTGAADCYRELLEQAPMSAPALRGLGLCLLMQQELEEALKLCAQAAALHPGDAECRYAYGFALGKAGRFGEAVEEFDAALQAQPNHAPAKAALVYSLMTHAQELGRDEPLHAEPALDRAFKLDSKNPEAFGALLNLYVQTGQRGKAIRLLTNAPERLRSDPKVGPLIQQLQANPEYANAIRQSQMDKQSRPLDSRSYGNATTLQQVPCPNCRQPIMDYAAICPYCNFQNRAVGRFAGRQTGPAWVWQDVAYTIMSLIWCLSACYTIYAFWSYDWEMGRNFMFVIGGGNLLVGLGLLFRLEWIAFLAKILCMISLFLYGLSMLAAMMTGDLPMVGANLLQVGFAGFLIYLINYQFD
jgi:tetratricopeptide (TPR) repeat protein